MKIVSVLEQSVWSMVAQLESGGGGRSQAKPAVAQMVFVVVVFFVFFFFLSLRKWEVVLRQDFTGRTGSLAWSSALFV